MKTSELGSRLFRTSPAPLSSLDPGNVLTRRESVASKRANEKQLSAAPCCFSVHTHSISKLLLLNFRFASVDLSFSHTGEDTAALGFPTPKMFFDPSDGYKAYYGHVGSYLPIVVFLFTKAGEAWELDYVPIPEPDVKGQREQPLFIRVVHITAGQSAQDPPSVELLFNHTYAYLGSYADYRQYEPGFYDTVVAQRAYWENLWVQEKNFAKIGISDASGAKLVSQSMHSIVKDMLTRRDYFFPSYGVYPGYGIPGNNGFQEIFTVSLPLALEYGMFDYAKGVLKNFLDYYWLTSGNVRYRGLEMAEVGRMLTQIATFYRYTGDHFFIDYVDKINGSVSMLKARYQASLQLPKSDPAYGIIFGNDEADCWKKTVIDEHTEYPYYSMSAETVRAFVDLGNVFVALGQTLAKADLISTGQEMIDLSRGIMQNMRASLDKARHSVGGGVFCLPYAAGTNSCTNISPAVFNRVSEPWRYEGPENPPAWPSPSYLTPERE